MRVVKEETEHGFIEYELPSIPMILSIMSKIGLADKKRIKEATTDELMLISRTIASIDPIVKKVEWKRADGSVISNFDELSYEMTAMTTLTKVAGKVLELIYASMDNKKKS